MTVHCTITALDHLLAVHGYVGQNSTVYADRVIDRRTWFSEQLGLFPQSGQVVPEYERTDIREVIEQPYRIIYRVKQSQVDVLAVIHSAQQLPPAVPE